MEEDIIKVFMNDDFKASFYIDLLKARSYFLVLKNIIEKNKLDIISEISFNGLIETLVLSVCRMYDYNSSVGCVQKEVNRINGLYHEINHDIEPSRNCEEKEELIKLIGLDKNHRTDNYDKLLSYRDKVIAHKDFAWEERYSSFRKCKLLDLIDPFISFAEKIYDEKSCGEREEQIYNIRRYIEMEG